MKKLSILLLLSLVVLLVFSFASYSSVFAEGSEETPIHEHESESEGGAVEETAWELLDFNEMILKIIRTDVVAGNSVITDNHFKVTLLIQNTSPYAIRNPFTSIAIADKEFNEIAEGKTEINQSMSELVVKPGQSKLLSYEFESMVDVVVGQSVKDLTVTITDYIYGERLESEELAFSKGTYVFVNSKLLNVKVADPDGYVYLPAKNLLEALGYKYSWNAKTSTFSAIKGDLKLEHKIGTSTIKANGKVLKIEKRDTAFVNKVPMISLKIVPVISKDYIVSRGTHDDVMITVIADKTAVK